MRYRRGLAAGALLLAGATIATCVYPTEHDAAVHVSLTPVHILFSGHDTVAAARAWQVRGPGDSVVIPNVAFTWSTSDAAVATVSSDGRIVGIKSGSAIITAAATNFDAGQRAAVDTVRVSAPIEVDSIRPKTVRYGEFLTVYGIGVDSIFVASLDSASLIPNPVEDTTYAQGTQRRRYWVPFPARTDSLLIIGIYNGNGVFGFVRGDTTKVVERDIYEPDDTIPHHIDLDAAPPFAIYSAAGRYGLGVIAGYQSELPADAHEDDNSCNAADLRDTVPAPFRDTLAIENPHDVDWIRFHYTNGGLGTTAQFRTHAFPGTHPDSLKDLDLYVVKVPQPSDTALQVLLADTTAGSDVNRTVNLATGDYYLVIVDFAGVATTYEVCVGTTNTLLGGGPCNSGFPAPPAPSSLRRRSTVARVSARTLPLPTLRRR